MKKNLYPAFLFCSLLYLVSCKKESSINPVNSNIQGSYTFISLTAITTSTQIVTDGTTTDKTITRSNYTTKDNTGTLTIDASKMTSTGLSYRIDTMATADYYEDNVFIETYEVPFQFTVPTSSSTSEYKWVTSDSVYFASGTVFTDGVTSPSGPSGARIKLEGDKLYVTGSNEQSSQDNSSGYLINSNLKADIIAIYQKQ
ncbi:MAG: hypothetical protein JWM28_1790 [Chitinophagaceae bacterium]|nr:hypothetical protein [Chitinophagaceae bacterium]